MKSKFIYAVLKEQNGEYSYRHKQVHEISSRKNPNVFMKEYICDFYGKRSHVDGNTHYFNGGEVAVQIDSIEEISKSDFLVLQKYL